MMQVARAEAAGLEDCLLTQPHLLAHPQQQEAIIPLLGGPWGGMVVQEEETTVMCLIDYLGQESLEDEDELVELQENITDLCSAFGRVKSVRIPRAGEEDAGMVFVHYDTAAQARKAVEQLAGKVRVGEEGGVRL